MPDLSDFEFTDQYRWKQQVLKDLNIQDIRQITEISLSQAIVQPPYVDATSNTAQGLETAYRNLLSPPSVKGTDIRDWISMELLQGKTTELTNKLALDALNSGAGGIIIEVDDTTDHRQLLKGISLSECYLGLEGTSENVIRLLDDVSSTDTTLAGHLAMSDLMSFLFDQTDEFRSLMDRHQDLRTLVVREFGTEFGTLQEIAQLLSQAVMVINRLMEAGASLTTTLANIQFRLVLSNSYLWEICRLRCLRILFHQVICKYGLPKVPEPSSISIHGIVNMPNDQASDSDGRIHPLIQSTSQAMSAILGGCNFLTVMPHSVGPDGDHSDRLHRNVSNILREESFLGKVLDPVAGAYYLEGLTHKMLREIWTKFTEQERTGGYQE